MSNEDINKCCMGFNECSSHNSMLGCVGCIDGYLVHICAPSNEEFRNFNSYFSGRYKNMVLTFNAYVIVCVGSYM